MPFRRFSPQRGYYQVVTWRQIAAGGLVLLCLAVAAGIILASLPPRLSPEQQALLDNVNCLRTQAGLPALRPDGGLMAQAQKLAGLLAQDEWPAAQQIQAAGGGVVRVAPRDDLPSDPCQWRWFIPLDPNLPLHELITAPELARVGFGYVRFVPPGSSSEEEAVVYLAR